MVSRWYHSKSHKKLSAPDLLAQEQTLCRLVKRTQAVSKHTSETVHTSQFPPNTHLKYYRQIENCRILFVPQRTSCYHLYGRIFDVIMRSRCTTTPWRGVRGVRLCGRREESIYSSPSAVDLLYSSYWGDIFSTIKIFISNNVVHRRARHLPTP